MFVFFKYCIFSNRTACLNKCDQEMNVQLLKCYIKNPSYSITHKYSHTVMQWVHVTACLVSCLACCHNICLCTHGRMLGLLNILALDLECSLLSASCSLSFSNHCSPSFYSPSLACPLQVLYVCVHDLRSMFVHVCCPLRVDYLL